MRTRLLFTILAAGSFALSATPAWADFKPTKLIEMIVQPGPGGGADVLARFIASTVEKEKEAGIDFPNVAQVRGVLAPPGMPADALAYYEDLFGRVSKSGAWKKYLEENQFEDGFQKSADLSRFFDEYGNRMRDILKEAGAKVVR